MEQKRRNKPKTNSSPLTFKAKVRKVNAAEAATAEHSLREAQRRRLGFDEHNKRDMYSIMGYPSKIEYKDYKKRYERQDIARRIVDAYPFTIWANPPLVRDDESADDSTPFEIAFSDLAKQVELFSHMNRADRLCRLGQFSILFLGFGGELQLPIKVGDQLNYISQFGQDVVKIKELELDKASPRFGKPISYEINIKHQVGIERNEKVTVHYSRIIHIAEGLLDNDIFGDSCLRPVYNRLIDLEKVVGGSAEIFWLNGRGGISVEADKDTVVIEPENVQIDVEDYMNQLNRFLITQGMDIKPIQMNVHPPDNHVNVIMDLIASATAIPKRILLGTERGELASNTDEANWLSRVDERRRDFCEPHILRPFVDRMIDINILPVPNNNEFRIKWPELHSASEKDIAEIAAKRSIAVNHYGNTMGANLLIPPKDFVSKILQIDWNGDEDEYNKAMKEVLERTNSQMGEGAAKQKEDTDSGANNPKK